MKNLCFVVVALFAFAVSPIFCTEPTKAAPKLIAEKDVPQYLQDVAVTIRSNYSEGSGTLKVTKDGQVWVWTCGHVITGLRTVRENSDKKNVVEFEDAKVVKIFTENGRRVGGMDLDAEVIRYSDPEHGDDLSLLRLRAKKLLTPKASAVFYLDKEIPAIGSELYHCGSLLGTPGSNSLTSGIISQHGRLLFSTIFDQTTCAAFPGSSGGIVCLKKDGRYVGMVVRGAGETFNLIVPVRRMQAWAKKVGVEFAMDDNLPIPTDEELKKRPVDDDSAVQKPATESAGKKDFSYRIKLINEKPGFFDNFKK